MTHFGEELSWAGAVLADPMYCWWTATSSRVASRPWAGVKAHLDTVTDRAAAPIIAK